MEPDNRDLVIEWGRKGYRLVEGICGHCRHAVRFDPAAPQGSYSYDHYFPAEDDEDAGFRMVHVVVVGICPRSRCRRPTVVYQTEVWEQSGGWQGDKQRTLEVIFPRGAGTRADLPDDVPLELRSQYAEAGSIEALSPNGCAFLCGRIVERALRQELQAATRLPLHKLIDRFAEERQISADLSAMLTIVRGFRNIAGHAGEDGVGGLVNVDHGEASFLLDATAEILDFVYVRPAKLERMTERLEAKRRGNSTLPMGTNRLLMEVVETSAEAAAEGADAGSEDSDAIDDLPF